MSMRSKLNRYMYYIVVFVISLLIILVMPLMGSKIGLKISLPNTVGGWIVYVGTALIVAGANMILFFSFMEQAKLNVQDNEYYQKANDLLIELAVKNPKDNKPPRSPQEWNKHEYSRKGIAIFCGTLGSSVALTNAVLSFNVVALISYSISVIFAVILGLFQMKKAERYWTDEFYRYAKYEEKQLTEVKNDDKY